MSNRLALSSADQAVIIGQAKGGQRTVIQMPMWGKGFPIYYWAEKGRIHWIWENPDPEVKPTEKMGTMSVRDCLLRIDALNEMKIKSSEDRRFADVKWALTNFVDGMVDLCREAKEQGEPFDEDAIEERRRRKPKTYIMPTVIPGCDGW